MKVKRIVMSGGLEKTINDFIRDKKVIDIKYAVDGSGYNEFVLIMYEERMIWITNI